MHASLPGRPCDIAGLTTLVAMLPRCVPALREAGRHPSVLLPRWRPSWRKEAGCRMSSSAVTPPGRSRRWPRWPRRTRPSGKQPRCSGAACTRSQPWTARHGSICRSIGIPLHAAPPCDCSWLLSQRRHPDYSLAAFLLCRSVLSAWLPAMAATMTHHLSQSMACAVSTVESPTVDSGTLLPQVLPSGVLLQEVGTADGEQQDEQAYCMLCLGHDEGTNWTPDSRHFWCTAKSAQGTADPTCCTGNLRCSRALCRRW